MKENSIRVAYDISALGQGYVNPKARAGVFRTVESLFCQLATQGLIDISPISFNGFPSLIDEENSIQYLRKHFSQIEFDKETLQTSRWNIKSLHMILNQLHCKTARYSPKGNGYSYKLALLGKLASDALSKIDSERSFEREKYSIYHSPFYPLPSTSLVGNIPRIITIYDLIPVLFPKSMTYRNRKTFSSILRSINIHKDWVICISENTKRDFCKYTQMPSERVFVIPLAAQKQMLRINNSSRISEVLSQHRVPQRPYMLSVCTIEPRKNLKFLII